MALKKAIGRLIPYPAIHAGRTLLHWGPHRCSVCEAGVRRYRDSGYGYPVLERLQVVGGLRRRADSCPVCHSSSRERLVWFWLDRHFGRGREAPACVAHFAPEKGLTKRLRALAGQRYAAYDFDPSRYRHLDSVAQADLGALPIKDGTIDLLVCNHVIEHVPDAAKALAEIHRVLVPGGTAILQVPIALRLEAPIELGADSDPEERIARLGQDDHLRLFDQAGYLSALTRAGFDVEPYNAFDADAPKATEWRLDPFEVLFVCRKPAGGEPGVARR